MPKKKKTAGKLVGDFIDSLIDNTSSVANRIVSIPINAATKLHNENEQLAAAGRIRDVLKGFGGLNLKKHQAAVELMHQLNLKSEEVKKICRER